MGEGVNTIRSVSRSERNIERLDGAQYTPKKERERQEIAQKMKTMPKPKFGFTSTETTLTGRKMRTGKVDLPDGSVIDIFEDGGGGYYVRNTHPEKGQVQKRTMFFSERMAVAAQKREYKESLAKIKKKYNL